MMGDSTTDNVRAIYCNSILRTQSLATISNVRGDSIRKEVISQVTSGTINNIMIDWGYGSMFKFILQATAGLSEEYPSIINHNIFRNVVNPKLINKNNLDDVEVTYDMGVVSFYSSANVGNNKCRTDINLQGVFKENIKDGTINYESDKVTTLAIPITVDVQDTTSLSVMGRINIILFDINISDVINDVSLVKNYIYLISGSLSCDNVILNGRPFRIQNLTKDTYDKEHIIYLGDSYIPCYGSTDNRPVGVNVGFRYFDTDINCEIVWDGSQWVNTDGLDADSTGWALIE